MVFHEVIHIKETEYVEYKYVKQKYLLDLGYQTIKELNKPKLIEKYKLFYISKMDSYNEYFTEEEVGNLGELSTTTSLNNIPSLPPVTQYKGYKIVSKEIASDPNEGEFIAPSFDEGATFGEYATTTKYGKLSRFWR